MNRKARTVIWFLMLLAAAVAFGKDKPKDGMVTLEGSIVDSQCAYNVHSESHSHDWMIKRGVQQVHDERSCTTHCVNDMGGSYVLVVKKDIYRLDDPDKAELFAGKNVKITGTLDEKSHTLHVVDIQ
jgi:hypothetical protein